MRQNCLYVLRQFVRHNCVTVLSNRIPAPNDESGGSFEKFATSSISAEVCIWGILLHTAQRRAIRLSSNVEVTFQMLLLKILFICACLGEFRDRNSECVRMVPSHVKLDFALVTETSCACGKQAAPCRISPVIIIFDLHK